MQSKLAFNGINDKVASKVLFRHQPRYQAGRARLAVRKGPALPNGKDGGSHSRKFSDVFDISSTGASNSSSATSAAASARDSQESKPGGGSLSDSDGWRASDPGPAGSDPAWPSAPGEGSPAWPQTGDSAPSSAVGAQQQQPQQPQPEWDALTAPSQAPRAAAEPDDGWSGFAARFGVGPETGAWAAPVQPPPEAAAWPEAGVSVPNGFDPAGAPAAWRPPSPSVPRQPSPAPAAPPMDPERPRFSWDAPADNTGVASAYVPPAQDDRPRSMPPQGSFQPQGPESSPFRPPSPAAGGTRPSGSPQGPFMGQATSLEDWDLPLGGWDSPYVGRQGSSASAPRRQQEMPRQPSPSPSPRGEPTQPGGWPSRSPRQQPYAGSWGPSYSSPAPPPPPPSAGWPGQYPNAPGTGSQQGRAPSPPPAASTEEWGAAPPGGAPNPYVTALTTEEKAMVLPPFFAPIGPQYDFYRGSAPEMLQRAGLGLAAAVLFSKFALLGAGAFTYPLWSPWVQAIGRNFPLAKYEHVGLWRCRVLDVFESEGQAKRNFDDVESALGVSPPRNQDSRYLRLIVGDDWGAETEVNVPLRLEYLRVRVGEPAELIVVSDRPQMDQFKAVREVYLPKSQLWIAEYPFLLRENFLRISYAVERERLRARERGQGQGGPQGPQAPPWPQRGPGGPAGQWGMGPGGSRDSPGRGPRGWS